MHARLLAAAGLLIAACSTLEPLRPTDPASVSAFSNQTTMMLQPGASRTLAIQVLDTDGVGVNDIPVVFVRPKSDLLRFDADSDGMMETFTTRTASDKAYGIAAPGLALSVVTAPLTTTGGTAEVLAGVVPADSHTDAGARFVVFKITVAASDAGATPATDGGSEAGSSDSGKGDAQ